MYLLQDLIDTFEELKKYVFIINRGDKKEIIIRFKNENFYHLTGLHKINIDRFFPNYIKTKSRKYEFIKKNISKFDGIINNHIQQKDTLLYRVKTFPKILDLLKSNKNVILYDLSVVPENSLYNGDFGLLKMYENDINCLLGLKKDIETITSINCAPQSWMANTRVIKLTEFKKPLYMENISIVPIEVFENDEIYV